MVRPRAGPRAAGSPVRRAARAGPHGELVRLADQDRSRWDRELIAEGHELLRGCIRQNQPGPYQVQAAIAAAHADAATAAATDWAQIIALYDHLQQLRPSAVVALNRAIAVMKHSGPAAAALGRAITLTSNTVERRHLERELASLG